MCFMNTARLFALLNLVALLSACAGISHQPDSTLQSPVTDLYCDRYFSYQMCAKDSDGNGDVDYMYFQDTGEIFMHKEGIKEAFSTTLAFHACAQTMNQAILNTSSKLLYINEETSLLKKTSLKSKLILDYASYLPKINQCNNVNQDYAFDSDSDDFGNEDYDDL